MLANKCHVGAMIRHTAHSQGVLYVIRTTNVHLLIAQCRSSSAHFFDQIPQKGCSSKPGDGNPRHTGRGRPLRPHPDQAQRSPARWSLPARWATLLVSRVCIPPSQNCIAVQRSRTKEELGQDWCSNCYYRNCWCLRFLCLQVRTMAVRLA